MLEISAPAPQLLTSAAMLAEHHPPSFITNLQIRYLPNNGPCLLITAKLHHLACSGDPRLAKNVKGEGSSDWTDGSASSCHCMARWAATVISPNWQRWGDHERGDLAEGTRVGGWETCSSVDRTFCLR